MIKRVRLERWKSFPSLDVTLLEGTSFIVAKNGVGKTSLLQALHFGLFGDRRLLGSGAAVEHAVRGDGATARVTLDLELNGVSWNVSRTVPGDLKEWAALPPAVVTANGREATDDDWVAAFSAASGVSMDELRLLSAIGEGGALRPVAPGQYDLVRHLSDVLGVTRMRGAAKDLRARSKATARAVDQERLTKRDRPQKLLEQEHERLIHEQGEAHERLRISRERFAQAKSHYDRLEAWEAWRQQRVDEARQEQALRHELVGLLGTLAELTPPRDRAPTALDVNASLSETLDSAEAAEERLQEMTQRDTERLGALKALVTASTNALEELRAGDAVCPTCLRPMTDEEASAASAKHEAAIASGRSEQGQLEQRLGALRQIATAFRTNAARLQRMLPSSPPPDRGPEGDEANRDELMANLDDARSEVESADEAARDVAAKLRLHANALAAESADQALGRRLHEQYREADLAELAAASLEGLAERICSNQIAPLAQVLAKRWLELWPGRPTVGLDVTSGELYANHESTRLDASNLSGGERTVASVLLRLLALQSASTCPVLLLDEPLEHLDPRNRRMLAGVLVAAGKATAAPRQILVTTYEESVTRRLSGAAGSPSHVIYIRPGPHV